MKVKSEGSGKAEVAGSLPHLHSALLARPVLQFFSLRMKHPQKPKYYLAKKNALELQYRGKRPPPSKYPQHHQNAVIQLHVFLAFAALAVFSSLLTEGVY